MSHRRTRQRQGRDFNSVIDYLRGNETSLEGKHSMVSDGTHSKPFHDDEANRQSILSKLDQAKDCTAVEQDTERAEPVDGREPPERGSSGLYEI